MASIKVESLVINSSNANAELGKIASLVVEKLPEVVSPLIGKNDVKWETTQRTRVVVDLVARKEGGR